MAWLLPQNTLSLTGGAVSEGYLTLLSFGAECFRVPLHKDGPDIPFRFASGPS